MQPLGTRHRHLAVPVEGNQCRQSLHCKHRLRYMVLYSGASVLYGRVGQFFWPQSLLSYIEYLLRCMKALV